MDAKKEMGARWERERDTRTMTSVTDTSRDALAVGGDNRRGDRM